MIFNIFLLLLAIIILIVVAKFFKTASGSLSVLKLNLISVSFYFYIIFFYIGNILILFGYSNSWALTGIVENRDIVISTYLIVLWTFFSMGMTMFLIKYFLHINFNKEYDKYLKKPISSLFSPEDSYAYYLLIGLLFVSIISIIYVLRNTQNIALFSLFSSSAKGLARLRIETRYVYNGSSTIRDIFALTFTPILSYIFYVYYQKYRQKKWLVCFLISFFCSLFIKVYDLQKMPIILYLASFIFLNIFIFGGVRYKNVAKYAALAIFLAALSYRFVMQVDWAIIPLSMTRRLFISQIAPLYWHIDIFPDLVNYLEGKSLANILTTILDINHIRSGRVVMEILNPSGISGGTAGVMCTLFVGEAFANFGWLALIIAPIYVGTFIQFIYILLLKLPKNPLFISINAYLCSLIPSMMISGFADFIFNHALLWLIIIWIIFYFLGLISKRLTKNL